MRKTIDIYTCRVQDHVKLRQAGIDWVDTTVKSGIQAFAPPGRSVIDAS